jgi:hypothetical protein
MSTKAAMLFATVSNVFNSAMDPAVVSVPWAEDRTNVLINCLVVFQNIAARKSLRSGGCGYRSQNV